MKKCKFLFCILVIIYAFSLSACSDNNNRELEPTKYLSGTYLVGSDIPEGEYVLFNNSSSLFHCKVTTDKQGFNILWKENSYDILTIKVNIGEYLTFENGYAIDIENAEINSVDLDVHKCLLKVGKHILPGEYIYNGAINISQDFRQENKLLSLSVTSPQPYYADERVIFTVNEGEYISMNPDITGELALLSDLTAKRKIEKTGMYKVGVDLEQGSYTFKCDALYNGNFNFWYKGQIDVYNNKELVNTVTLDNDEETTLFLTNGQYVIIQLCDIIHADC